MNIHEIAVLVADNTGVLLEDMKSQKTNIPITAARQCAMYLCLNHASDGSHRAIAKYFNRHKSTTYAARINVTDKIHIKDPNFYWVKQVNEDLYSNVTPADKNPLLLIAKIVEEATRVTVEQMRGKSRVTDVRIARQCAQYLACKYVNDQKSLSKIGLFFNRDHSTVLHSREVVENMLETRNKAYLWVEKIIARGLDLFHVPNTGDDMLNMLMRAHKQLEYGNIADGIDQLKELITMRQITLQSLESMKADQMLHEQMSEG